jgi:membrane-associated protease RseP (regulator of RpoE activity)
MTLAACAEGRAVGRSFPHPGSLRVVTNVLLLLGLLWIVTAVHELGHALAVRLRRGRIRAIRIGRGPGRSWESPGGIRWRVGVVPVGGRIHFDGIAPGTGRAVVAVSGAAANLALAAVLLPGPAAVAEWLWLVPGGVVELVTGGRAMSVQTGVRQLGVQLSSGTLGGVARGLGALSALWAGLNLIPVPGATDGWAVLRGGWDAVAPGRHGEENAG